MNKDEDIEQDHNEVVSAVRMLAVMVVLMLSIAGAVLVAHFVAGAA